MSCSCARFVRIVACPHSQAFGSQCRPSMMTPLAAEVDDVDRAGKVGSHCTLVLGSVTFGIFCDVAGAYRKFAMAVLPKWLAQKPFELLDPHRDDRKIGRPEFPDVPVKCESQLRLHPRLQGVRPAPEHGRTGTSRNRSGTVGHRTQGKPSGSPAIVTSADRAIRSGCVRSGGRSWPITISVQFPKRSRTANYPFPHARNWAALR